MTHPTAPETWELGVSVLTAAGYKETTARAMLGKWLRDWKEAIVVEAIELAAGKADPKAYIMGVLARRPKKADPQGRLSVQDETSVASRDTALATIRACRDLLKRAG